MKNNTGQNLIFLISQPRAGSTMLQRMLGSHPDIYTTSEPWVMLHPLYALKQSGIDTEYSSDLALDGLHDFLSNIENGDAIYNKKLREMYSSLYEMATIPSGKKFYLDKTPRYYFIIEELHELFFDAKFIILLRNPLAVLASMVETWTKQEWFRLSEYKHDLLRGPDFLMDGMDALAEGALRVVYEDVVSDPEKEINLICQHVGIDYDKNMINYGNSDLPRWKYGDPERVYEKSSPDSAHTEKWVESLANPQVWRVMRDYLDYLGESRLSRMGYSFHELDAILKENRPPVDIEKCSLSLNTLLDNVRDAQLERKILRDQVSERDVRIKHKDEQIKHKDEQIKHKDEQIKHKDEQLNRIKSGYSYRLGIMLLSPMICIKNLFKRIIGDVGH